jgi:hypothetical protein
MEVSDQLHIRADSRLEKELPHALTRRLGGPQSLSERFGEETNLLPLPGFDPLITIP